MSKTYNGCLFFIMFGIKVHISDTLRYNLDANGRVAGMWCSSLLCLAVSKQDAMQQKREERKAQRHKELEEKRAAKQSQGAMKLGAKKASPF